MFNFLVVTALSFTFFLLLVLPIQARTNSFISIVNPVRGNDFWDLKNQKPIDATAGQMEIIKSSNLEATWLIRPDALKNSSITEMLKAAPSNHELGLFLEITPSWTSLANVKYQKSASWHNAGSVFLTGYTTDDRKKLIETAFEEFKKIFGFYPKSVGAWFVDSYSLSYMQEKYDIDASLIVADQYSTDDYQIWGQYWGTSYYPQKRNALVPAQSKEDKLSVVIVQWATRDPVNGYGKAVEESTYSVQANDYIDYHDLNTSYFSRLVDIYTNQKYNSFNHLVVGLENSYLWQKYKGEYANQIKVLADKSKKGQFGVLTMGNFAKWYKAKFPDFSPEQIIIADDPLGNNNKAVWFMNPYYRSAWFYKSDGSIFRDIRQYLEFQEQLCFDKPCKELNFATSATRVLDDVSFRKKWLLDEGKISNFKVERSGQNYLISYVNDAGTSRRIELLPRDISVDGKISSIDETILDATQKADEVHKTESRKMDLKFDGSFGNLFLDSLKFIVFLIVGVFIPGFIILKKFLKIEQSFIRDLLLSFATGLVVITLITYGFGFLKSYWLLYIYLTLSIVGFIFFKIYSQVKIPKLRMRDLPIFLLIIVGSIFQMLPVFRSGLKFSYGLGFWGPNGHDGVWHISLITELVKGLPAQNPVFSGTIIKNYHYLYDLFLAASFIITKIEILDLFFRFVPLLFSLFLGIATLVMIKELLPDRVSSKFKLFAISVGLYLTYFSGSFGWIATWLRDRNLAGESAFWANQSISFNLNPPFAISLILFFSGILLVKHLYHSSSLGRIVVGSILIGSLIGFKAYAAILFIATLGIFALFEVFFKKRFTLALLTAGSIITTLGIYLPNFKFSNTFILSPFWFVHTMIDVPDRVGWIRLSSARTAYIERGEWLKYLLVEILGLIIFIFGNLGMRFIGLHGFIKIGLASFIGRFLFVISILSVGIPIFFIQQGTPWNTIQFLYYFLYISSIFVGVSLVLIWDKFPKFLALTLLIIVVILAPINSIATAKSYLYPYPHTFISAEEIEGLSFLKNQPEGVVLTYPYDDTAKSRLSEPAPLFAYETSSYVSAFTGKRVFLEDEIQNEILGLDYKKRRVQAKDFFTKQEQLSKKFLQDQGISYIYLPKFYRLVLDEANISKIYENEEVNIYKVN